MIDKRWIKIDGLDGRTCTPRQANFQQRLTALPIDEIIGERVVETPIVSLPRGIVAGSDLNELLKRCVPDDALIHLSDVGQVNRLALPLPNSLLIRPIWIGKFTIEAKHRPKHP